GIFHPYYVSLLAPFTAALVGAGAAQLTRGGLVTAVLAPLAVVAGVVTEIVVLHDNPGQLGWLVPLLVIGGVAGSIALSTLDVPRLRAIALAAVLGLLLVAPAAWAADTLGHATNGTLPAGGPATVGFGGPGGGPRGFAGGGPRGFAGPGATTGGGFGGGPPGTGTGATAGGQAVGAGPGGGMFGGDGASLTTALRYVQQHGGGTIGVSSQTAASSQIIASGAKVAGIGGFSGRESEVSVKWLADAVSSGRIRWILVDSAGGGPGG